MANGIATGHATLKETQDVLDSCIKVAALLQQYTQGDATKWDSKDVSGFKTHADVDTAVDTLKSAITAFQA